MINLIKNSNDNSINHYYCKINKDYSYDISNNLKVIKFRPKIDDINGNLFNRKSNTNIKGLFHN